MRPAAESFDTRRGTAASREHCILHTGARASVVGREVTEEASREKAAAL